ncbi:hypothetical protein [Athalassotoga sp.]|uniref:hypothetical protein n=1 Tax=Athalassotoga sp. TaxID=2022597 RepID=UPI003CFBE3FD
MKYTTVAAILAAISILIVLIAVSFILPPISKGEPVSYFPQRTTVQFSFIGKPSLALTPYTVKIVPTPPSTMVAAINQIQPQQPAKPQPVIPQTTTPKPSPTQTYVPPIVAPQIPKVITPPSTVVNYNFLSLQNVPNFQSLVAQMRKDYIEALQKLPTEIAYTLAGTVKGIVEVQTDGNVKVLKIINSPSVVLTDIYVRNIEKFVTFPRSLALEGIEIDATFTPSGTSTGIVK